MVLALDSVHGAAEAGGEVVLVQVVLYRHPEDSVEEVLVLEGEGGRGGATVVHDCPDSFPDYEIVDVVFEVVLVGVELFHQSLDVLLSTV